MHCTRRRPSAAKRHRCRPFRQSGTCSKRNFGPPEIRFATSSGQQYVRSASAAAACVGSLLSRPLYDVRSVCGRNANIPISSGVVAFCKFRSDILGVEPGGTIEMPDVCLCPVRHWCVETAQPQKKTRLIHPLGYDVGTTSRAKAAEFAGRSPTLTS
jgi:hypothetical protein